MTNSIFHLERPKNEPVLSYGKGSIERQAVEAELVRLRRDVEEIGAYINGSWVKTGQVVDVTCPHDHQVVIARCHQVGASEVYEALKGAAAAQKSWAALSWHERASVFIKAADLLAGEYRAFMNAATMLGQSKTIHQAEIDAACELIDFFRFNAYFMTKIYSEQPLSVPGIWNRVESRGLEGFVYAIAPFNFTSISVNLAAAPALMGCTVLWKPPHTGVFGSYVGMKLLEAAGLPKGVINMIPGDPEIISQVLLTHPDLAGIHFTGSTKTFHHLWRVVGQNIERYRSYPRLVGETGGKDFVLAHSSAATDELVTGLIRGAFEYQGQKCSAASRAYIPESLWPEVKSSLIATCESIKVGPVEDFSHFLGAVIDARSFARITGYIERAKASKLAKIIAGGEFDDKRGYFIRPTIIETKDPHYETMVEEIFGPVLTVYIYKDEDLDEVINLVQTSTMYALTGAIYARDRLMISELSEKLLHAAGNLYINDKPTGAVVGQQPFGGSRGSGTNDKAGSVLNLTRWISQRTVKENFIPQRHFSYPYMAD